MTSKERLLRLFNGQDIDRIPIWLLFPYHRLSCYVDVYNIPCYANVVKAAESYADIFDRRGFDIGFCLSASPEIQHCHEQIERTGLIIDRHIVRYKDIELFEERAVSGSQTSLIKHMVEDVEDLNKILAMPYVPPQPDVDRFFDEQKELGERGLMMVDIGDPLGILYHLCSVENFAMWTILEKERLTHFLDVMYERYISLYKYLLGKGIGPVYFIVGAEFAGPPVVSPANFNGLCAHYVKGIVDLIRSYGMKSIVHYHGNLKKVLDGMKYINPDGLHTIEAPPVGDCTIAEARKALGDMILIGNIQYDDLARKGADEIEAMVQVAIEEGKSGRFILSPTAGPYEPYISPRMQENYVRFMEAGYKYGRLK